MHDFMDDAILIQGVEAKIFGEPFHSPLKRLAIEEKFAAAQNELISTVPPVFTPFINIFQKRVEFIDSVLYMFTKMTNMDVYMSNHFQTG